MARLRPACFGDEEELGYHIGRRIVGVDIGVMLIGGVAAKAVTSIVRQFKTAVRGA